MADPAPLHPARAPRPRPFLQVDVFGAAPFRGNPLAVVLDAVREDPVTGSLNASAAQWMTESPRLRPPYTAVQGSQVGRDGRVRITRDDAGELWVGGAVHAAVEGMLTA